MNRPRRTDLTDAWAVLRRPENTVDLATSPLAIEFAGHPARAGVDGTGSRHLLIPASTGEDPRIVDTEGAVSVRVTGYGFAGQRHRYLDIACHREDLFDLFDDLAHDVLIGVPPTDPDPASAAATLVRRWRSLLSSGPRRTLSPTEQMAMFAELYVLELVHPVGPIDATSWRGPLREPHDIVLPKLAFEVKAIGPDSDYVTIHGIDQLAPPDVPLALVLVTLTQSGADAELLPDVVDRFLGRASDRVEALRRLRAADYSPLDRDAYPTLYAVSSIECIEVGERTPRIVRSSFAEGSVTDGIDRVSYRLELARVRPATVVGTAALRSWAARA